MSTTHKEGSDSATLPSELNPEQTLGLIGLGLLQKMSHETASSWNWSLEDEPGKADLIALKQRLELTALAIETSAPLSTSEVTQLLGARPGSPKTQRGGLVAKRISRNVWRLSKSEVEQSHWRN